MSLSSFFTSDKKKQAEAMQKKRKEDATHYHMEKRRFPIRMIFPMPTVTGTVDGGVGGGNGWVSGSTNTKYGLMIFYETGNGGWAWEIIDTEDIHELLHFTDDESHVVVQYQCANSDNHIMNTFYEGVYVNRHWQQTGR